MRLEHMTPMHVRRAVETYLEESFPGGRGGPTELVQAVQECRDLDELFALFERDSGEQGQFRRYALRLGNDRYPFMKLIVQEYLVNGEFFFSVDTHDNLEIGEDNPDFIEWMKLKRRNRELKLHIERAWDREGLPTHADLQGLMEELARVESAQRPRARLLVVDDETHVAFGLKALLAARGYTVELAHDGREALERLGHEPRPDLVLLDNDMPELSGRGVLERIRANPDLADLPVLMATAARIDLRQLVRVSGFLRKPYPRQVLFRMIERLLEGGNGSE